MKIFFCTPDIFNNVGGGILSLKELISHLVSKHKIYIFFPRQSYHYDNFPVEYKEQTTIVSWKIPEIISKLPIPGQLKAYLIEFIGNRQLMAILKNVNPDLVVVQGHKLLPTKSNKSLLFLRDLTFGHLGADLNLIQKLYNYPFAKLRERNLQKYSLIITNSDFLNKRIGKITKKVSYIYPFIKTSTIDYRNNFDNKYITFVNPTNLKGVEIFLRIVNRLKSRKFLVVGHALDEDIIRLKKNKNVTYLGFVSEIDEILRNSRLLLIPSVCEETFGRVVVEASSHSIPPIASTQGGLPEAVGKGGSLINDYYNIDQWIIEIMRYDDKDYYYKKSLLAYEHSKNFRLEKTLLQFENIVSDKLSLKL